MMVRISDISLPQALAAEVCVWGLLAWRMLLMAPAEYRVRIIFGLIWTPILFNLRDRSLDFGFESAAAQIVALYGGLILSTLGKREIFHQFAALSVKKDAVSKRIYRRIVLAYTVRLIFCVAVLMALIGVLVQGALLSNSPASGRRKLSSPRDFTSRVNLSCV